MTGLRSYADPNQVFADADVRDAREMAEWLAPDASRTFYPGEPIAKPRGRRADASMTRALLVVVLLSGVGWALVRTEAQWRPLVMPVVDKAVAELQRVAAAISAQAGSSAIKASTTSVPPIPPQPVAARDIADAPGTQVADVTSQPQQPTSVAATPDADAAAQSQGDGEGSDTAASNGVEDNAAQPAGPLPPPEADPADPHQARALAAGLHPKLSLVLLTRLTAEDYRNARTAIAKALAEVADDGKLEWPKQRAPERALFTVHFVPGAADDCRRYVVSVTKDRWTTTALPMERCGVASPPHAEVSAARS